LIKIITLANLHIT